MRPSPLPTAGSTDPEVLVALVGAAAALLGAIVGGGLSYWGSIAIHKRAQRTRAAIRRKAKLYTPLRAQLLELLERFEDPDHYHLPIQTEGDVPQTLRPRPNLTLWSEMVDDGRSVSVTKSIALSVARSVTAIEQFNDALALAQTAVDEIGRDAYRRVMGTDMTLMNWASSGGTDAVIHDREDLDLFWDDRAENRGNEDRIRALINENPKIQEVRAALFKTEDDLKDALQIAISDLEGAMQRIARKYEQEPRED